MLLLVFAAAGSATTAVPPLAFAASVYVIYPSSDAAGDAESITIGKLNGDTRPDLAIISDNDSTVSVVLNRGAGRFKAVAEYDTAPQPSETAIADVNGDGKPDLLVTNGRTVSVLLNHGGGTFLPRVDYPAEPKAPVDSAAIAVGDLNGDGRPDVVIGDDAVTSIAVLLNRGDGTFGPPVLSPTASPPDDLKLGDLNGDGKLDAVVASSDAKVVSVFTGAGNGTLAARTDYATGGHPVSVALADFNGDGKLDAASGNCCASNHGISLFLNRGGGRLAAARDYAAGEQWYAGYGGIALDAADVNGDGRADFVYLAGSDAEEMRLNRGGGHFEPQLTAPTTGTEPGLERGQAATGDLNGDGRPDQAYATLNTRNGDWNTWVRLQNPRFCDVQPERSQTLAVARRTLALANCRVGRVAYTHTSKVARGRVVSQAPAYGGAVWRKGKRVDLVVSLGR